MADDVLESGFLDQIGNLTHEQTQQACEAALANAKDLLAEADILRSKERCARAYFLAHIACEELGKIPILITAAVSERTGYPVDWGRIDRVLRSHTGKIGQVLFMDSIVGDKGLAQGEAEYQNDLKRMRSYTDAKNASLYSFFAGGQFVRPLDAFNCEFFDGFRPLAHGRLEAFEGMYVAPVRRAGGVEGFLEKATSPAIRSFIEILTGAEGRQAFELYKETGDENQIRALFDRLISDFGNGAS